MHNKLGDNAQVYSLEHFDKETQLALCCAVLHVGCISKTMPSPENEATKQLACAPHLKCQS